MEDFLAYIQLIPEGVIASSVYLFASVIVLLCWSSIASRLPTFIGRMSSIILFALILTPTVSEGYNAGIAPAIFGLVFGLLTKDTQLIWLNLALIVFVIGILSIVSYAWAKYTEKRQLHEHKNKPAPL